MKKLNRVLRKYFFVANATMQEKLSYAGNFTASLLTYGVFVFIFSQLWANAYSVKSDIAGYTRNMMIWYFIIAEIPMFGFSRYFISLSAEMKSGDIAYMINRPYSFLGFNYASKIGGSLIDAGILLFTGVILGLILAGSPPNAIPVNLSSSSLENFSLHALKYLMIAASLILSGTLNYFLQSTIAMTALWFEENEAFYWIFQKLSLIIGTLVPIEFLPEAIVKIARFTPFPYIAYTPARMMVAFSPVEGLKLMACQIVWIIIGIFLANFVFSLGRKRLSVNGG